MKPGPVLVNDCAQIWIEIPNEEPKIVRIRSLSQYMLHTEKEEII